MKHIGYKNLKLPFTILSSKAFLLWLIGGWLIYYVSSAIWMEEAFAFFVSGVEKNILIQLHFVLFIISGYLNIVRVFEDKLQHSKIGFIAWFMLSLGVMLYFSGFFLSLNLRASDNRLVGEGDLLKLPWSTENYRISSVMPGLKDHYEITDITGVLEQEPKIGITDSSSKSYEIGAYPPVRIGGTYMHILNFGFAPGVRFYRNEAILNEGYMALRLLPPGRSDFFDLRPHPYRFLVSLRPDHVDSTVQGHETVFNLKAPMYDTRVFSGEKIIAEDNSETGVVFDDYRLQFYKHKYWVQLESAKDPGIPVMRFGIYLLVFGIPVYMLKVVVSLLSFRAGV